MRNIGRVFLVLLMLAGIGIAATRSDINVIEAAENIRFISQKIAKNYLYLYSRPQHQEIKDKIYSMIKELGVNFETIASSTNDNNTKNLLEYLEYNRDNIKNLLDHETTKKNSLDMLDFSEVFLEAAESIARNHKYDFNKEEAMLMNIKRYEYLIERLGKFYMASGLGPLSKTNKKKMVETRNALDAGIKVIMSYHYPEDLEKQKKELKQFWDTNSLFLSRTNDMFTPNLVIISDDYFEKLLSDFALYHSKSQ